MLIRHTRPTLLLIATALLLGAPPAGALTFVLVDSFDTGGADSIAGMAYDPSRGTGHLLLTDDVDDALYEFERDGTPVGSSVDLNNTVTTTNSKPGGIEVHPGGADRMLIADTTGGAERIVDADISLVLENGSISTSGFSDFPTALARVASSGLFWVTDRDPTAGTTADELFLVDLLGVSNPVGTVVTMYDTSGFGLDNPVGMTIDPATGNLVVVDSTDDLLYEVDPSDGSLVSTFDLQAALGVDGPRAVAFAPASDGSGGTNLYLGIFDLAQGSVLELAVPEPGTFGLTALGLGWLAATGRRRRAARR